MIVIGEFALGLIYELLSTVIVDGVKLNAQPFFEQRKIKRRVEDATAEVVEPLLTFLSNEGVSDEKQRRLIQTCIDELRPFTQRPERLFQGSLDGQKIFDELYAGRELPQTVTEDGLRDVYTLLFPRIATLLCRIPAAIKDWESQAWSENYRRLDEIIAELRRLFAVVDDLTSSSSQAADELLAIVRRTLAQKIRLELDLTGLRADRPMAGKFDDFFVHPEIKETVKGDKRPPRTAGTPDETFAQFVTYGGRAVVIGAPGAGKSTWAKWLQREALTSRWPGVAIRVELRRFSQEPSVSLHALVREAAGQHLAEDLSADRIARWLREARVLFILDGFDEIRPGERDKVHDWIKELSTAARCCAFVLTSRPLTTDHLERLGEEWPQWSMEPFDKPRIIEYIERWYSHTPLLPDGGREVDATALAGDWLVDPAIGPLTGNPLLLSTLLMVHHLDGRLPNGRAQLYHRYVDGMLGLWDDRRQVVATDVLLTQTQKHQIMRGLALRMFLEGQEQWDEPVIAEWLGSTLLEMKLSLTADDVLTTLRERSGLLIGPGIYSFAHKTVMEYLVAESVLQGDQRDTEGRRIDRLCLFEHRNDDRWNTVTFLWAGLAPVADLESFIRACVGAREWPLAYGVLYDQWGRIPRETRQQSLLAVSFEGLPIEERSRHSYVVDGPVEHIDIRVPAFELRSLNKQFGAFPGLVRLSAQDGTLTWSECSMAAPELRALVWVELAIRGMMSNPPDEVDLSIELRFLVIRGAISRALWNLGAPDIALLVDTLSEVWPQATALLPLALMSAVRSIIRNDTQAESRSVQQISSLLTALPGSDKGQVIPIWLAGTQEWASTRSEKQEKIDLLANFIATIDELAEQGILERNETYRRAIEFVEQLRQKREPLDPAVRDEFESRQRTGVALLKVRGNQEEATGPKPQPSTSTHRRRATPR